MKASADDLGTVLIVDDDVAVRRSAARLLRSSGFAVETFGAPAAFLRRELPAEPACVLLDMYMDGMTGLGVQEQLQRSERHIPIIFMSGCSTIATAVEGVRHGAEDFLEKPVQPKALIEAIRGAIQRDRAGRSGRAQHADLRARYASLTPREREVMALVVSGLLNKQSAAELGISEKTIKVHRARVMQKMRVESLAELVLIAEHVGVTGLPGLAQDRSAEAAPCVVGP